MGDHTAPSVQDTKPSRVLVLQNSEQMKCWIFDPKSDLSSQDEVQWDAHDKNAKLSVGTSVATH